MAMVENFQVTCYKLNTEFLLDKKFSTKENKDDDTDDR